MQALGEASESGKILIYEKLGLKVGKLSMQLFKKKQAEGEQVYVDENKKIRLLRINFSKDTLDQVISNVKDFKTNYRQYLQDFPAYLKGLNWRQKPIVFSFLGGVAAGVILAMVR